MSSGWQIPLPSIRKWRPGRCHCCNFRPTLVAAGPVITTINGVQVALPWCLFGFERANRMLRRATLMDATSCARPIPNSQTPVRKEPLP